MGEPIGWVIDLEKADDLLRSTALCMAMNISTDLREQELDSPVLQAYLKFYRHLPGTSPMNEAKAISVYSRRDIRERANELYEMFFNNFRKTLDNPKAMALYLQEKDAQHRHAWESVRYKFEAAREVNNQMVAALNHWHARAAVVKVACDAAVVVLGAVVPLTWVASTAVGFGYSLACKVAANTSEARDTSVLAYGTSNAISQWGSMAQDKTDDWALQTARRRLYEEAEKKSHDATAKFLEKLGQYTAQKGANLTAAQERRLAPLTQQAIAAQGQLEAARKGLTAPVKGVADVYREAQPAGKAGLVGVRAAGIAVGLLFILPDAISAVREVKSSIVNDNTR